MCASTMSRITVHYLPDARQRVALGVVLPPETPALERDAEPLPHGVLREGWIERDVPNRDFGVRHVPSALGEEPHCRSGWLRKGCKEDTPL